MKKVAVIVVTYNRIALLLEEIESLRRQTYNDFQIVVVNNGSTDGTKQWLEQQNDLITINQENIGGAGGFYAGIKYAAENEYECCWVMDDDVECGLTALEELMKIYETVPDVGFVCSRVVGINGQPMNIPNINSLKSKSYSNLIDFVVSHSIVQVIHATFVSVLFPVEIIKEVGLPLKEYFIWGDDVEYTRRISNRYACYIACRSVVVHKRNIQGSLNFEQENNPNRISMNFYKFRNELHNEIRNKDLKAFLSLLLRDLVVLFKLVCKLKFKKVYVLMKGVLSVPFFRPKVQYPNLKQK